MSDPVALRPRRGALERLLIAYARNVPLRQGKMRVVDHLWKIAVGPDTRRMATIRYGGMVMPCDLSETLQRQYYFFGTYFLEEQILDVWREAAKGARVVFDIGANAGIYSLAALSVAPDAAVHAFEPTPEIAERLRRTAEMNRLSGLQVHEAAVMDADGEARLQRCRGIGEANEGMNYITADPAAVDTHLVRTVSLDAFCDAARIERIDLLKMDIQGNEAAALDGARRLISDGRISTIFMELTWFDEGSQGCPATQSIAALSAAGYRFADPRGPLTWRGPGDWLRRLSDVVAIAPGGSGGSLQ